MLVLFQTRSACRKNLYFLFRKQHGYEEDAIFDNELYEYPYAKVASPELTPAIPITLPDALVLESDHVFAANETPAALNSTFNKAKAKSASSATNYIEVTD